MRASRRCATPGMNTPDSRLTWFSKLRGAKHETTGTGKPREICALKVIDMFAFWSRTLLLTGGAQAAIQLLGVASGILVIRHLSSEQYAYYTIANAALGMMTVLTDSGINSGVLAQASEVWRDPAKLGAVVTAGLRIRRQLALVAVTLSVPILFVLLRHQGADWPAATLIVASILPTFLSTISAQLFEAVPRLQQRLVPL